MKKFIFVITFFLFLNTLSAEDKEVRVETFVSKIVENIIQYSSITNIDNPDLKYVYDNQTGKIITSKVQGFAVKIGLISEKDLKDGKKILTTDLMCFITSNALNYIEKKSYGDDFYKKHLYFSKLDEYKKKIINLDKVTKTYREAVSTMYARGILNLNKDGMVNASDNVSNEYSNSIISISFLNKGERQDREINRYLEIFPGTANKFVFNSSKDNFKITVESQGSELPVHSLLTIDKNGEVVYKRDSYNYGSNFHDPLFLSGKISSSKVNELFNYIVNDNYFFILPSDMSTEMELMDSSTETITIEYNDRVNKIGGYHPFGNKYYNLISGRIKSLTESITKDK